MTPPRTTWSCRCCFACCYCNHLLRISNIYHSNSSHLCFTLTQFVLFQFVFLIFTQQPKLSRRNPSSKTGWDCKKWTRAWVMASWKILKVGGINTVSMQQCICTLFFLARTSICVFVWPSIWWYKALAVNWTTLSIRSHSIEKCSEMKLF